VERGGSTIYKKHILEYENQRSMKYLYGASIQGIQDFIFETNQLKEIAGASEIVAHICSDFFKECVNQQSNFNPDNLLIGAAGNIKYIFDDVESCKKLVYYFPKNVMKLAPGITISQAVVKIDGDFSTNHIKELEKRLKTQRNKKTIQPGVGLMVSERSRKTGKPGIDWDEKGGINRNEKVVIDAAQSAKRKFTSESRISLLTKLLTDKTSSYFKLFPEEIEDIAGRKDSKRWIAVIHADGNDLGKKIMKMAEENGDAGQFKEFSQRIGRATELAAKSAFENIVIKNKGEEDAKLPFRPIILGGDDFTVIIRGDLAIDFTDAFLRAFEIKTKEEFKNFKISQFVNGITACAGIAYIKPNYPFHYGVSLAEELCKSAKKIAKKLNAELTPSCLLFHKVHSSFTEDYQAIVEQELTTKSNIRFDYGPYFIEKQEGYATINELKNWVSNLNEKSSPASRLRNWLSSIQLNMPSSEQDFNRIKNMTHKRYIDNLKLENPYQDRNEVRYTHLFDAISLSSIENK
jgi:CRISPR/Cas system-associated protein Cas10 (large subunit of type III CRISPR-Cas system)